MHNEKRINPITVRFEDSLLLKISRLAAMEERELADFIHHQISQLINGLGNKLSQCESKDNQFNSH